MCCRAYVHQKATVKEAVQVQYSCLGSSFTKAFQTLVIRVEDFPCSHQPFRVCSLPNYFLFIILGINSLVFFFPFSNFGLKRKLQVRKPPCSLQRWPFSFAIANASFRLWARHFPHNLSLPEDLSLGAPSNGLFLSSWRANCSICSISKNRKHVSKVDLRLVLWPQSKLGILSMLRMFHPLTQC